MPRPAARALIAKRHEAHHMTLAELPAALAAADIVVSAQGAGRPVVTAEAMAQAIKVRRHRPVLLIDVAVPADVEPAVDRLDDVFRYELDDLERAAMQGRVDPGGGGERGLELDRRGRCGILGRRAGAGGGAGHRRLAPALRGAARGGAGGAPGRCRRRRRGC